ncbi:MarR family winged helix-turn-helix transcriptional regulator [Catellatospora sp. NPDC049133]|jgi:DNA-binding MarR family transcriptional regulator|uniref:MarR family winged helix-turn-helix transcriptional regulator n=1 Tax=Catellatospora sp. NPDC049133 TaxID=3155499 RepID=UPI003410295E
MPPVPGLPPTEQLVTGLARLGQAIRIGARRNPGPYALSELQADIVTYLAGDLRPRRQNEVVRALASTAPTISDAVRTLLAKELVERERDALDSRAFVLTLTPAGVAEARRLTEVAPDVRAAISALAPDDLAAMLRGTTTIIRELQDRHAIPLTRMCLTCRFFAPDAHPEDPARPHHCLFADAPFGDAELRVTCSDHEPTPTP